MGPIPLGFLVCKIPKVKISQWKRPLGATGAEVGPLCHGCDSLLHSMGTSLGVGTVSHLPLISSLASQASVSSSVKYRGFDHLFLHHFLATMSVSVRWGTNSCFFLFDEEAFI